MHSRYSWIFGILLLAACASAPSSGPQLASDQTFGVPTELADKFSVKDKQVGIPVEPVAAPAPAPAPAVKGKKGKATKVSKKTAAPKKAAAEAVKKVTAPAKPVFENRWKTEPFFKEGEKYVFDITYFGATAGRLSMELLPPKTVNERQAYHIRAIAQSVSPFTLFYRLNDTVESFMDTEGLFSHKFSLKMDESLQQRDILELYDQKAHKVYYWSKLDHKKKGKKNDQFEIDTEPYTQDGLSAFYYLRTIPMDVGSVHSFHVVNNGKLREVRVTVVRKEELKTKIGTFDTVVLKPEVVLDGAIKTYGDSFVWVSDDPRRLLLKIDAKIKVGSIIGYLREHSYAGRATAGR